MSSAAPNVFCRIKHPLQRPAAFAAFASRSAPNPHHPERAPTATNIPEQAPMQPIALTELHKLKLSRPQITLSVSLSPTATDNPQRFHAHRFITLSEFSHPLLIMGELLCLFSLSELPLSNYAEQVPRPLLGLNKLLNSLKWPLGCSGAGENLKTLRFVFISSSSG